MKVDELKKFLFAYIISSSIMEVYPRSLACKKLDFFAIIPFLFGEERGKTIIFKQEKTTCF